MFAEDDVAEGLHGGILLDQDVAPAIIAESAVTTLEIVVSDR